ncbi:MAG TPA: DUF805 domain-containing protein [Acidiphilium sp.]|nr:DUF805 domain-containing protein [Acidiphilium sp.]HQU22899.1 DUF805 domain-containing protein [Acidiphilium sp.]
MNDDLNHAPREPLTSQPTPPPELPPDSAPDSASDVRRDDQKFCFSCATLLHASATACPKCGASQPGAITPVPGAARQALVTMPGVSANMAYCRGCGQTIHATAPLCPHCGAPQRLPNPYGQSFGPPKSRVTAALLAFFLGGLGAHKFYLDNVGVGLLYLFLPNLAVQVRRLHDRDWSGWFALLLIVPLGVLVLLIIDCLPGTQGPNRFGAPIGATTRPNSW